jgi:hypothetical protein
MISGPSCDCNKALDFYRSNFSDNPCGHTSLNFCVLLSHRILALLDRYQFPKDKWMCSECPWVFSSCAPNKLPESAPQAAPLAAAPTTAPNSSAPVAPPELPPVAAPLFVPPATVSCGRGCIITLGNRPRTYFSDFMKSISLTKLRRGHFLCS